METRNTENMGERLRSLRVDKGISQESLAKRLRLGSRSMVCEYESGKRTLSAANVASYADYFNVSADWILFGSGDSKKREFATETEELLKAFYSISNPRARRIAIEQIRALTEL